MGYLVFIFLAAVFMGAFEKNFMLFIIVIGFGYMTLGLVPLVLPGKKGK